MPVITIELGTLTKEQKEQLVESFVTSASEILNIPQEAFVTLIKENSFDNVGNGTKTLTNLYSK